MNVFLFHLLINIRSDQKQLLIQKLESELDQKMWIRLKKRKSKKMAKSRKRSRSGKSSPHTLCKRGYDAARAKFYKYPSAYANMYARGVCDGRIADPRSGQKRRSGSPKKSKKGSPKRTKAGQSMKRWQQEKWVDVCRKDKNGKHPPCGLRKGPNKKLYPYCRPSKKISNQTPRLASSLTSAQKKKMCQLKNKNPSKRVFVGPKPLKKSLKKRSSRR